MKIKDFICLTLIVVPLVFLPPVFAQDRITFWTTEVEKDRLAVQNEIITFLDSLGRCSEKIRPPSWFSQSL